MLKFVCLLALVFPCLSDELSFLDKNYATFYHVKARELVRPRAANMRHPIYSKVMVEKAKMLASQCILRRQNSTHLNEYKDLGVNMAVTAGAETSIGEVMDLWIRQEKPNGYTQDSCSEQNCLNYRQIINAESELFGCAKQRCDGLRWFLVRPVYLYVCVYEKRYVNGQKPYIPGTPCSRCPQTQKCEFDQCVRNAE